MKALTLTQPWATAIMLEHKRVETRSWSTRYRGVIAIHAAKGFPHDARKFAETERALGRCPARIPLGAVIGTARIAFVMATEDAALREDIAGLESIYGDYSPGRFAWFLEDVRPFVDPIPARGSLGLWEWTPPTPPEGT